MATLSHFHFLTFLSLPSRKLFLLPQQHLHQNKLHCETQEHPPPKQFTTCALSNKKPSSRTRKVKSNEELCNDIQQFLTEFGFPEDHVPSTKELSLHGRNDLANIVRRRGYKLIRELLANSTTSNNDGLDPKKSFDENQGAISDHEHILADNAYGILNERVAEESKEFIQPQNLVVQPAEEHSGNSLNGGSVGSTLTSKDVTRAALVTQPLRDDHVSPGLLMTAKLDKDLDTGSSIRERQADINHLKFMLHQKELELSLLKEQIGKEKLALSDLQTKAEAEISKAQKLISEKDAELEAAEGSLSGLEEVSIQYFGEGEIVEVSGSFNGWHQRIKMDPQPSSSITDPNASRNSRLWSTVLWLYPGTYEIKFIVDGHWRTDPRRESVTTGTICNNILRVDK